jgi:hypothetical protein
LVCAVRIEQDPIITALGAVGLLLLLSSESRRNAVLAGVCLGMAVCVKYPAIMFLPVYVLAAPRRAAATLAAMLVTAAAVLLPFTPEIRSFVEQTVTWQLVRRTPLDLLHRLGTVTVFWLLLNPLAVIAALRRAHPAWLPAGFSLGGIFLFTSQAYYHYFVPVLPFAALLGAPIAADLIRRRPRALPACAVLLSVVWAVDLDAGTGPGSLFVTASNLSSVQATARVLDRWTSPGAFVLTDQFEYAFLAGRKPAADYFWNMSGVVPARALESRLPRGGAVVMTRRVAPTYPSGFTGYLRGRRYLRIETGTTDIWLLVPIRLQADVDLRADTLCADRARRHSLLSIRGACR